jgi:hypothetical protein
MDYIHAGGQQLFHASICAGQKECLGDRLGLGKIEVGYSDNLNRRDRFKSTKMVRANIARADNPNSKLIHRGRITPRSPAKANAGQNCM